MSPPEKVTSPTILERWILAGCAGHSGRALRRGRGQAPAGISLVGAGLAVKVGGRVVLLLGAGDGLGAVDGVAISPRGLFGLLDGGGRLVGGTAGEQRGASRDADRENGECSVGGQNGLHRCWLSQWILSVTSTEPRRVPSVGRRGGSNRIQNALRGRRQRSAGPCDFCRFARGLGASWKYRSRNGKNGSQGEKRLVEFVEDE